MPSSSKKQHRFMEAIAHGWKPDKSHAPSKEVAKDFVDADKKQRNYGVEDAINEGAAHLDDAVKRRTQQVKKGRKARD
jgi:hypothetical protein